MKCEISFSKTINIELVQKRIPLVANQFIDVLSFSAGIARSTGQ